LAFVLVFEKGDGADSRFGQEGIQSMDGVQDLQDPYQGFERGAGALLEAPQGAERYSGALGDGALIQIQANP